MPILEVHISMFTVSDFLRELEVLKLTPEHDQIAWNSWIEQTCQIHQQNCFPLDSGQPYRSAMIPVCPPDDNQFKSWTLKR
jgi:hypothetical protein